MDTAANPGGPAAGASVADIHAGPAEGKQEPAEASALPDGRPQGSAVRAAGAMEQGRREAGRGRGASLDEHGRMLLESSSLAFREYEAGQRAARYSKGRIDMSNHYTVLIDPDGLHSKYGSAKVREMVERGEVIEWTTPWYAVDIDEP